MSNEHGTIFFQYTPNCAPAQQRAHRYYCVIARPDLRRRKRAERIEAGPLTAGSLPDASSNSPVYKESYVNEIGLLSPERTKFRIRHDFSAISASRLVMIFTLLVNCKSLFINARVCAI